MGILVIILGIMSGIAFFNSGNQLNKTGNDMKLLRSEGGNSLAEVYYQEIGEMNKGLGVLANGFGLGIMSISIGIGTKLITSNKSNIMNKNTNDSENEKTKESL